VSICGTEVRINGRSAGPKHQANEPESTFMFKNISDEDKELFLRCIHYFLTQRPALADKLIDYFLKYEAKDAEDKASPLLHSI